MFKRDDRIKEIRILPMELKKSKTVEDVQQYFFRTELKKRKNCSYRYRKYGLKAEKGAMILFQYNNHIIAIAQFDDRVKYDKPDSDGYGGILCFDRNSIAIFEPITANEMKRIWTDFKGFSHVKQNLSGNKYPFLWDLLKRKNITYA